MLYQDEEGSRGEFLRLLAEQGEEPAFVSRRRRLDAALETLRWGCRLQRRELLDGPRIQLRRLRAVVNGDWSQFNSLLQQPARLTLFASLHDSWERESPAPSWANQALWTVRPRRALADLYQSVERFNRAWVRHLDELDLQTENTLIDHYNQYYVLEKACAFGREDIAVRGFETLPQLSSQSLLKEFPVIEMPLLKRG